MTKKEQFISEITGLIDNGLEISNDAKEGFEQIIASLETKEVKVITEKGIEIILAMREHEENYNNVFTSKIIGESIGKNGKAVAGSMRKLIENGFVENLGGSPKSYALTDKGRTFDLETI